MTTDAHRSLPRDPVERMVAITLAQYGIRYVTDSPILTTNRSLDFYLPDYGLYIECKRFATERLHEQVKDLTNVIIIQGVEAAAAFDRLISQVYTNGYDDLMKGRKSPTEEVPS